MPKVSVILTSFNHEKYLREAIDSALNQTFTDFELIIWDDASADGSWSVISSYSDSRIKAFRNESTKRGIYGINKAISEVATGEYIAIHHSDDVWEPDKLEKQVAFLDTNTEIGAVFTNALAIAEDSSPLAGEQHYYSNIFDQPNRTRHEWLRFFFNSGNALCHPSALIRKACYEDCGLYRYGLAQLGDFDMWIRLCLKYEIHVLPEKLVRFRVRDNEANASASRPESRIRTLYEFYKLLPNYRKLTRFEDMVKVFPSAEKYYRNKETDMNFVLGMAVLEQMSFPFTQLFGQDILFEAISDPERVINIKRLYDFDYKSFIALTGQHDVFSREEIAERDSQIAHLESEKAALHAEIRRVKSTVSWQITKPLRLFAGLVRNPQTVFTELSGRSHVALRADDYSALVPFGYPAVECKSTPSLAVICHMFYVDMADEFARYFSNIPFQFDLYITTDTQEKREKLEKFFSHWKGEIEVRIAPNRGRDIAPKLITCRDVYDHYEYILHIHTKKSPHHGRLSGWRFYLLETLLGSTEIVKSVFEAFRSSPNLGIIAPQHFEAIRKPVGWGRNFKIAKILADRMGIEISRNVPIDFPSGSMFWARTAAIKPLLDCNLTFDEFPEEAGQLDETLGHAIERLYFFSCERAGYRWMKISRPSLLGNPARGKLIASHDDLTNFISNFQHKLIK